MVVGKRGKNYNTTLFPYTVFMSVAFLDFSLDSSRVVHIIISSQSQEWWPSLVSLVYSPHGIE